MAVTGKRGRRLNQYAEDYVVFDLETTGISPEWDSIIEISAIKVKGHKPVAEFSSLINPGRHIPEEASRVNGITDELVREEPELGTVLPQFLSFIGNEILVGHNIQSFDLKFLCRDAHELLGIEIPNDYVDTLSMARACLPQLKHHRLTDISRYFSIGVEGAHRALNDCAMNQKCYECMGKILEKAGGLKEEIQICPWCGGELRRRKGRFGEFFGCSNFPACRFTRNG